MTLFLGIVIGFFGGMVIMHKGLPKLRKAAIIDGEYSPETKEMIDAVRLLYNNKDIKSVRLEREKNKCVVTLQDAGLIPSPWHKEISTGYCWGKYECLKHICSDSIVIQSDNEKVES